MSRSITILRVFLALAAVALILPACGGGGGGGGAAADAVQFSAAAYSTAEGTTFTVTVTRTTAGGAVSVNFATSNGTATSPGDYTAIAGTLSWAAGDSASKTFDVVVPIDGAIEGDETVNLTLSLNTGGAALGTNRTAVLVITDLDSPPEGTLQFSAATFTVSEGAATVQATITVTRTGGGTGAAAGTATVTDGTATVAAGDYTAPAGPVPLAWAAGDSAPKTFTIDILNDAADGAPVETINLALAVTPPSALGTTNTAVLNIVDNDVAGTVQFTAAAYSVFESGVRTTITVTRINGSGGPASVDCTVTAGTATAGTDYVAPAPNPVVLNWVDGDIADKTFTIDVTDDAALEGNETIALALGNPGGVTLGAPNAATLTIIDDEPGTLDLAAADFPVLEGNAGTPTVTITVNRTGGSLGAASVQVNVTAGTATAGVDYVVPVPNPVTLNWLTGESGPMSFNITINSDVVVELDETINLQLQNEVGAGLGVLTAGTATITNDDVAASGNVQFNPANVLTVQETGNTIVLNVSRVGGNVGTVTVNFATSNGSAVSNGNPANRDFVGTNGTLTWLTGDSADKQITVTINNNDTNPDAANETFSVTLSAPTGGATIVGTNPVTVTIQEN